MSLFSFAAICLQALAINFACSVFFMRYCKFAWSCIRCNDIESTNVLALRAWTGVALYPLEISHRHLFCTTDSLFSNDLVNPLTFLGACHTADPYVIAGFTTAVYTCRALEKVALLVEVVILARAKVCLVIFFSTSLMCICHLSLVSI